GIGAAEAVHRLFGAGQAQIVGKDLDHEQHDVDVVEKTQVDLVDVEGLRFRARPRKRHANLGDVPAAKDSKRGFGPLGDAAASGTFAVQEAPYVRKERYELAVVAFVQVVRFAAELVPDRAPRMLVLGSLQNVPGLLNLRLFADGHHLQRPDEDLPEMANQLR